MQSRVPVNPALSLSRTSSAGPDQRRELRELGLRPGAERTTMTTVLEVHAEPWQNRDAYSYDEGISLPLAARELLCTTCNTDANTSLTLPLSALTV